MSAVPVRGTQSFVGVMAEVFKRPSLTGLEVLWRWVFWGAVLGRFAPSLYVAVQQVVEGFQAGGFPALSRVLTSFAVSLSAWAQGSRAFLLLALFAWVIVAATGRRWVLARATPGQQPRMRVLFALTALRWFAWVAVLVLWCVGLRWAICALVTSPQQNGSEPSWVPFCALLIGGTLLLFVLWLGTAWVFLLAEIYAGQKQSLGSCLRRAVLRGPLAGKLAEINLVMGIVKIALLVLAMVFSACPLPFETVETQSFLLTWTAVVLLLYFIASDYFHVVRIVAFLRMTEVFGPLPKVSAAPDAEAAS